MLGIVLVVDHRSAFGQGLVHREHRREDFVVHLDQIEGLLGDGVVLGGHRRHVVADEADLGVEHAGVVGRGLRIALARRRVAGGRGIAVGEDAGDAVELLGSGRVDRPDAGVSVGATQDLELQRPR